MEKSDICGPHSMHHPPLPGKLPERIEGKTTELMQAFHRMRRVNVTAIMEVAPGEFFVLQIIEAYEKEHPDQEGIYVSRIAKMAKMASSQVSRMLKGLEERELIGRSVDQKDRRNTYVYLTKQGTEAVRKTKELTEEYICRVIERMGVDKVDELIRLCNRMAEVMEEELAEKRAGIQLHNERMTEE